jgi:soluble lytic murein transglycosylase-like protein
MEKKNSIQILFVEVIRFFFIFTMILSVSLVSIHIRKKADFRYLINDSGIRAATIYDLPSIFRHKKERRFHPIIIKEAIRQKLDPALVKAIIMAESGYNPNAVSKRGAKGLMQLMPSTASALGVDDAFNPEQNIRGGVRYFKQLVNRFDGDVRLALAAYNAGSRKVIYYQGIPPFKSTHCYIEKVFKYYELYKGQMTEEMKKI